MFHNYSSLYAWGTEAGGEKRLKEKEDKMVIAMEFKYSKVYNKTL